MKDLKISKELFKAVYNCDITTDKDTLNAYKNINLYTFFFDCKEWAFSKGYIISSGLTPVLGINKDGWAEVFSSSTPLDGKLHTFKQLSEQEAVFKASEYILKEINENR